MFCFINMNYEIVGIYWNHLQIAQLVSELKTLGLVKNMFVL